MCASAQCPDSSLLSSLSSSQARATCLYALVRSAKDADGYCRLVKAGVIPQQYARRFNLVSAWAELVSYVGSIWLNALRIAAALERERALSDELLRRKKVHFQHD